LGNRAPFRQSTKRKRAHKPKKSAPVENSDPEDSDFSGEDGSSNDSDIEEVISNDELRLLAGQ
jgi:hypothetical protein